MPRPDSAAARTSIRRWIARDLSAHPPRAPSLIVTVWGDALAPHGGDVWLATLFRLLAPFGVNERLARTSVFRLARDGWLAARTSGRRSRYRLTAEGARRFAQAYRRVYTPPARPWDGTWEMVLVANDGASAGKRRALRDELAWEGFGAVGPGAYARPARADSTLPGILDAIGAAHAVTAFAATETPAMSARTLADRVADAWDLRTLEADYRRFIARFGGVVNAFRDGEPRERDAEHCFVVRTLLVHAYRRVRLRDPQLPSALLPADWPGAHAYALCRDFYRLAQPLAETHLDRMLALEGETLAAALPEFLTRFDGSMR